MVKKILLASVLIASLAFSTTVSFAKGASDNSFGQKVVQKLENSKGKLSDLKPLLETIRSNKTEIAKLRADSKAAYNKAKTNVKSLMKSKDSLTDEKIEQVKQALNTLEQDRKVIADTHGEILSKSFDLKVAKRNKDHDAYEKALNEIITIQNTRIEGLKKVIEDMNAIADISVPAEVKATDDTKPVTET